MRLSKIVLGALILPVLAVGCKPPPPPVAKAPPAPPQPVQLEQVKAGVGVGKKGRSLDGESGIIVTPVKAFFAAKEKISFEIEVPHALQLYKALSPDGRGPKTHEEFMTNVIEANRIKLPLLPPEHRYVYNPETEELMVERPKAAQLPVQP
jgi:hypothetical protein